MSNKNNDIQSLIAIVISLASLVLCYLFLLRLSEIEGILNVLQKSNSSSNIVDIRSLSDYLDRNVEVFSILTTTLVTTITFVIGFVGYQWITKEINNIKSSSTELIGIFRNDINDINNTTRHDVSNLITKQTQIFDKNSDQFLDALFQVYTSQAILFLRTGMLELQLDSDICAADVLQQHPQNTELITFLRRILTYTQQFVLNQQIISGAIKNKSIQTLTNMISKTTNQDEIQIMSMLISTITALREN